MTANSIVLCHRAVFADSLEHMQGASCPRTCAWASCPAVYACNEATMVVHCSTSEPRGLLLWRPPQGRQAVVCTPSTMLWAGQECVNAVVLVDSGVALHDSGFMQWFHETQTTISRYMPQMVRTEGEGVALFGCGCVHVCVFATEWERKQWRKRKIREYAMVCRKW